MEKELNLEQIQGELFCMLEFFDRLCVKFNYPFRTKLKFFIKSVIWKFYYLYPAKKKIKKINSINGYLNCTFVSCNASFDYIGRCVNKSAFFPTDEKLMFGTENITFPRTILLLLKCCMVNLYDTSAYIKESI